MSTSTAIDDTAPILESDVQTNLLGSTNESTRAQTQNSQSNQDAGQHQQNNINRDYRE